MGVPEQVVTATGSSSDSVIFSEHVPTLFLSTSMHRDYHRPTDTAEKIDYGQLERVVRLVLGVIREPFSSSSSRRLRSTPPAYPTSEPSAPTTR